MQMVVCWLSAACLATAVLLQLRPYLSADGQGLVLGDVFPTDELPDEYAVAPNVSFD